MPASHWTRWSWAWLWLSMNFRTLAAPSARYAWTPRKPLPRNGPVCHPVGGWCHRMTASRTIRSWTLAQWAASTCVSGAQAAASPTAAPAADGAAAAPAAIPLSVAPTARPEAPRRTVRRDTSGLEFSAIDQFSSQSRLINRDLYVGDSRNHTMYPRDSWRSGARIWRER